jgi:pyrimidine operon attenuation protein / uracil phosphoribosyltransferase
LEATALPEVEPLLATLASRLREHIAARGIEAPLFVGIHSGGAWLVERLGALLETKEPLGTLDISFYRDDYDAKGIQPSVRPSRIPWEVEGRHLIVVDDILFTGRTIRAALNELFDYGRPASVTLAVLITRDGRELPIQADVAALQVELPRGKLLKLRGPDPLHLQVVEIG